MALPFAPETVSPRGDARTTLTIRRVALDSLQLNPENARVHGDENMAAITASLKEFGQAEPIVVQKSSRRVVGGNGRVEAMRKMGWTECDAIELDIDDAHAAALGVALNRSGELASWDKKTLGELLEQCQSDGLLDAVGYSDKALEELIKELAAEAPREVDDPGPEEPPANPVAKVGDLWILGDHKLLCGDATNPKDVERVMNNELADLVATDPPYLVDYTGERPNDSGKDWTATYKEIEIKDADAFFRALFTNVLAVLAPHAAIYCWHAHKRCGLIQQIWADLGILDSQQIIWVKPASVFGRAFWHYRHEPCIFGWRKGSQPEHDGQHEFNSVWECDWDGKARLQSDHPTSKPTELFQRPMRKHTKAGAVCFEPFSGSGSCIIAAERERRKCYALEISPPYVDVAIKRWQTATGQQAVLDGDGRTFNDIAPERVPATL